MLRFKNLAPQDYRCRKGHVRKHICSQKSGETRLNHIQWVMLYMRKSSSENMLFIGITSVLHLCWIFENVEKPCFENVRFADVTPIFILSRSLKHTRYIFSSIERQDSVDIPSAPVLENPEHQTLWYCKFFLGKFHYNFVGQEINAEGEKSTCYVLSVVEEKSFGKSQCRCILWTKDGPKRLVIAGCFKSKNVKHILAQFGYSGSRNDQPPKQVRLMRDASLHISSIIASTPNH